MLTTLSFAGEMIVKAVDICCYGGQSSDDQHMICDMLASESNSYCHLQQSSCEHLIGPVGIPSQKEGLGRIVRPSHLRLASNPSSVGIT